MVGWHHWLDEHEFEQAPGGDDEQGSLVCCSPWDHKELDITYLSNWTKRSVQSRANFYLQLKLDLLEYFLYLAVNPVLLVWVVMVVVVQSLSCVQLFVNQWMATCQAPLSFTISQICSDSSPLSWWCQWVMVMGTILGSVLSSVPFNPLRPFFPQLSSPAGEISCLQKKLPQISGVLPLHSSLCSDILFYELQPS